MELWVLAQKSLNEDKSGTFSAFWTRYARHDFSEEFRAMVSGYGG
jgi:hypothetical protein